MQQQKLTETHDLERWVVDNPDILGDRVMIVTTQFDRWESTGGDTARERLDILALDGSGQLIVVELKRGSDRQVHLQAMTYAALVASFTKQTLAQAHLAYLRRPAPEISGITTDEEALNRLTAHVEAGDDPWDNDLLTQPKIVLIAEDFPAQVLTTVQWLTALTEGRLEIELHTVSVFVQEGDDRRLSVV
ncbi:MAG TPA: hypothetical protein VLL08_13785, partial [Kineosporiaceae bacterium]|nr:hypothetical protein [Kineosporiaceae bacterium]